MSKSSDNMADTKTKTRKANWADSEIICLVSECTDNVKLITGKHGLVSENDKTVFWRNLCERINSIGGCGRSVEEVVKKWKDLKSQTKKKEQMRRRDISRTGGGETSNSLREWEEKIITIIPDDVLHGIAGGEDIFQRNEKGEAGSSSGGSVETVLNVGREEVVLVHEDNVNVQVINILKLY
ncbi:uncharacterized protein LOC132748977 [Ruditapes philippinarum]|uniref:uncharacterized protein LOC132748977 n=1 Tax=Ruditapes philippinarum TaxID=129788 RepID=UPI00295A58D0|nr:uncharacterized protein LOC132748977 [Ruditapes philippinarum]